MTNLHVDQRAELLSRTLLFKGLDSKDLRELASVGRLRTARRKEEIFHKGDAGTDTYFVMSGRLKVFTTSPDGDDVAFTILGPGEVFGEIAMLADLPRTATVAALEPCELLSLDRRDLLAFLERHPKAAGIMLGMISRRLARLSELVEDTLFLNLPARLAKKFVSIAEIYGEPTAEGLRLDLRLSQAEWGDLVGTTRESINKQVGIWSRGGLMSMKSGYVVIHDMDEIERLADTLLY